MTLHWHLSIENILIYGLSAILVINVLRILASHLSNAPAPFGAIGRGIGAAVS